ncbi:MAG: adenine deaminase [bacterium]|nr:adenine deaminase [bacterium]
MRDDDNEPMELKIKRIDVARGKAKGDVLLKNARLVNVFSGEIYRTNVVLSDGMIAGIGQEYDSSKEVYDLDGKYLTPGLFDAHVHLESSLISPSEYAKAVIPHGTTSVIIDPHEIANVLGLKGIEYMLNSTSTLPLTVYIMVPSCVPATNLETGGATLTSQEICKILKDSRVLGLAELMNVPGVLNKIPQVLRKVIVTQKSGKIIDGHSPLLTGRDLNAYTCVGITSDHECTEVSEAREKIRLGMRIMIREGGAAKNLEALLPMVTDLNYRWCMFVSDDLHPEEMVSSGHMDRILRKAVALGVSPIKAVQMATINPCEYFGIKRKGGVAPGYIADLCIFEDLRRFRVKMVFKEGRLVAKDGEMVKEVSSYEDNSVLNTVHIPHLTLDRLKIRGDTGKARVIGLIPDQIVTKKLEMEVKIEDGYVVSSVKRDILKLVVIERHKGKGAIGLGLVHGFGLKKGALASSVAHDSHNLIIVGTNDQDMLFAARKVAEMGGGYVVVERERVLADLPLPIAGLMSSLTLLEVQDKLNTLLRTTHALGVKVENPFITLSFLALPVIPELRLTDQGLIDVNEFKVVPLFREAR